MMIILRLPGAGSTYAFDCLTPKQGPKYSLKETEACPEAVRNKLSTSKKELYYVYQESDFVRTKAQECIVKRAQTAWYCGRYSYTAMVLLNTPYVTIKISPKNCEASFQTGRITIDEHLNIKALNGKIIEERVSGDGTC